jgi:hypothetical protein
MDTNVEKLRSLGILAAVRQRLGAKDKDDDIMDEEINTLSNTKLIELYCGWHLGDGTWWNDMKYYFDKLEK